MREPVLAEAILRAVIDAAGPVPVTVKMRLGWDEGSLTAPDLAARLEQAGARLITVHGRTRAQLYRGAADPAGIAAVRRRVRIPLIANGDVTCTADARRLLMQTGADGVMVARATMGRPWLPAQIIAGLSGMDDDTVVPDTAGIWALARDHFDLALTHYGEQKGRRGRRPVRPPPPAHVERSGPDHGSDQFRPETPAIEIAGSRRCHPRRLAPSGSGGGE